MRITHVTLDFLLRHEGGHRVDDDDVNGAATHECIDDIERLLTGIRLGNQQVVDIDPELLCIDRIERMFRVDKGCDAALLLRLRNHMQRDCRFTRGLRPIDLNDTAAWHAAHAQCDVEWQNARWNRLDIHVRLSVAEAHDRAFAEVLLDLLQRIGQRILFRHGFIFIFSHICSSFQNLIFISSIIQIQVMQ